MRRDLTDAEIRQLIRQLENIAPELVDKVRRLAGEVQRLREADGQRNFLAGIEATY